MAHVDISTGRIFGCEEGTKAWHHEKGHLKFYNSLFGQRISLWRERFLLFTIFFNAITFFSDVFNFASMTFILSYLFLWLFEELWCDEYANKKMKLQNGKRI